MGTPSSIGYFELHLEQTRHFLSFVYSKSALHSGQAKISNMSFGIGSLPFCSDLSILIYPIL